MFVLVSFHLIMISMVKIDVLLVYIFCVWPISPVSPILFVFVELVCILKYKHNKSSLSNTRTVFIFTYSASKH